MQRKYNNRIEIALFQSAGYYGRKKVTTLAVGASGATGRLLEEQLLKRGQHVKIIVQLTDRLPEVVKNHDNLSMIHASVLGLSDAEMALHVSGFTSRINVGHFMADLITDDDTWYKWKGQMPVIYNKASSLVQDIT
jgi:hypothetical protein